MKKTTSEKYIGIAEENPEIRMRCKKSEYKITKIIKGKEITVV